MTVTKNMTKDTEKLVKKTRGSISCPLLFVGDGGDSPTLVHAFAKGGPQRNEFSL